MRWVLLDEVLEIEKGKLARCRSRIPNEVYSAEVLLVEMMAQAGALLIGALNDFQKDLVFAKIEKADFHSKLLAGDAIEIVATCEHTHDDGAWIDAKVLKEGECLAEARCLLMNVGAFVEHRKEPITFHKAFMNHFRIREKVKA